MPAKAGGANCAHLTLFVPLQNSFGPQQISRLSAD
jgi:hypothetical protein